MSDFLSKGVEVEQYIGSKSTGLVIPGAGIIASANGRFSVEPDARNIEYITPACRSYEDLLQEMVKGRLELRQTLSNHDKDWTVLPGSTVSLPFDQTFHRTKPDNPYHTHIEERHGLSILTTSIHYNIGLEGYSGDEIIRVCNLLRMEASLILAMTASSPFLGGKVSGMQSERWYQFPKAPAFVPYFASHQSYLQWNEHMVREQEMFNYRHLWASIRPNGDKKPQEIDRLEIRVADNSTHWETIIAIMAWIEFRVRYFLENTDLFVPNDDSDLIRLGDENEFNACLMGLSGHFSDWLNEEETTHYEAVFRRMEENPSLIKDLGLDTYLSPLKKILIEGNESTHKLALIHDGYTVEDIYLQWIQELEAEDLKYNYLAVS